MTPMMHVLDFTTDLFAMPPRCTPGEAECLGGCFYGHRSCRAPDMLPAVGDVIANTRTCGNDCARFDGRVPGHTRGSGWAWVPCGTCLGATIVWADPPFLRVVEVLPIVKYGEHRTVGRYVVVQVEEGSTKAFLMDNGNGFPVRTKELDLPGAHPGGWAIRVEPYPLDVYREIDRNGSKVELRSLTLDPPRFDGPPLNCEVKL